MHNILVIDDERAILSMLRQALTRLDYSVETAVNGEEGIQKFNEIPFDLVITDICMPGMDGNSVVNHIRNSDRQSTPIIGVSGTPRLFKDSDFDIVISKPYSIKILADTVKRLVETPSMEVSGGQ